MSTKTFKLELKNGALVIPQAAREYLNQCQGEIEVSLTIQSSGSQTPLGENGEQDFQAAWTRWFAEVDQLELSPPQSEPDEYGKALIEKYKKQGLEL